MALRGRSPTSEIRFLGRRHEPVFTMPLSEWVFEMMPTRDARDPYLECEITVPGFHHNTYQGDCVFFDRSQEFRAARTTNGYYYRVIHIAKHEAHGFHVHFFLIVKPHRS